MRLFRRGPLYLVYRSPERGFVYDARTGLATDDLAPRDYLGASAREWLPVPDDAPLPPGLDALLILKLEPKAPRGAS